MVCPEGSYKPAALPDALASWALEFGVMLITNRMSVTGHASTADHEGAGASLPYATGKGCKLSPKCTNALGLKMLRSQKLSTTSAHHMKVSDFTTFWLACR